MRKAFTLIEMLVSVSILSIMLLFLYKSYASLNSSNLFYKNELKSIKITQEKKKIIYLDFASALSKKTSILTPSTKENIVFTQTSHSLHKRYNPYVAYVVEDDKLYRLESLKEFMTYPINSDREFVADYLGEVNSFRMYKSKAKQESYLVHIDFKVDEDILLKINRLE